MNFLRKAVYQHCERTLLVQCILVYIVLTNWRTVYGMHVRRSSFVNDDTIIRTEFVDRTNRTVLAKFNLTEAQMDRIFADNNANNKDSTTQPRDSQYFNNIKEYRLNDIKNRLQSAFHFRNSEESQEHPLHEMAAYPICTSGTNESSWIEENNVTIRFSDSLFEPKSDNLNLDSAILRLYKINPNASDNSNADDQKTEKIKRCADPFLDTQIRVTVSIVHHLRRNKREPLRKRICNTIMMNVSKTGWIEIDVRRAIYIWENFERQQQIQQSPQGRQSILVGCLIIEVHDEEERPLKPGLYFKPPKCDQADLAIPWNYYGPHTSMSSFTANEVPRYPRLDVKLIGYASFAPKNYDRQLHQKLRENLRRQLYNLPKNSAEVESESTSQPTIGAPTTTSILPDLIATSKLPHTHRKRHTRHQHQIQQQKQQHIFQRNGRDQRNKSEQIQELQHAHRHHGQHRHHQHHLTSKLNF